MAPLDSDGRSRTPRNRTAPQTAARATPKTRVAKPRAAKVEDLDLDIDLSEDAPVETRAERRRREEAERKSSRRKKVFRGVGASFGIFVFLLLIAGGWAWWQFRSIDRVDVDLSAVANGDPFNFLLVGSDTRDLDVAGADAGNIFGTGEIPQGRRADTIVIARIDPKIASVELLSIPRDLWVAEPGESEESHRINATYADGPQMLIDVIEESLGIPINNYAEIDFNGFKEIVDGLGGVPLYFENPVYDEETGLDITTPGCQLTDGVQALAFARSRELFYSNGVNWVPDPTGDLGRITRQQIFMRRVLEKVSSLGLTDLNTLRVVAGVGANSVTLDESLSMTDILALGKRFAGFDPAGMAVHSLPTKTFRTSGGAAVEELDDEAASAMLSIFRGETPLVAPTTTAFTAEMVNLDVMNTSDIEGLAGTTAELLGDAGFAIGEVGNLPAVTSTVVRYGKGGDQGAKLLVRSLDGDVEITADPTLSDGEIQLVLADSVALVGSDEDGSSDDSSADDSSVNSSASDSGSEATTETTAPDTIGLAIGDPPPGVVCEG